MTRQAHSLTTQPYFLSFWHQRDVSNALAACAVLKQELYALRVSSPSSPVQWSHTTSIFSVESGAPRDEELQAFQMSISACEMSRSEEGISTRQVGVSSAVQQQREAFDVPHDTANRHRSEPISP